MSVTDDRRRGPVPVRGDLTERQRMSVPVAKLGLAAGSAHEIAHPLAGLLDLAGAFRVRTDARNAYELGKLVEPGLIHGA